MEIVIHALALIANYVLLITLAPNVWLDILSPVVLAFHVM